MPSIKNPNIRRPLSEGTPSRRRNWVTEVKYGPRDIDPGPIQLYNYLMFCIRRALTPDHVIFIVVGASDGLRELRRWVRAINNKIVLLKVYSSRYAVLYIVKDVSTGGSHTGTTQKQRCYNDPLLASYCRSRQKADGKTMLTSSPNNVASK